MTPREYAIALHQRAVALVSVDQAQAYRMIVNACEVDPGYADGWRFLGSALADMGYLAAACSALRHALRCPDISDETRHVCTVNLGHRLIHNQIIGHDTLAEAEAVTDAAIALSGGDALAAFAHTNRSLIAGYRGDARAEMRHAEAGFALCPEPQTEMGLAFACLFQGRYADGIRHFDARYGTEAKLAPYRNLPWPRWDGGRVGTLLIMPDMGLGDSLSFARFVPEARRRADRVILQCQVELVKLLAEALPDVEVVPNDYALPQVDAWCATFSLPAALGLSDAEIRDIRWFVWAKPVEDRSWKRRDARLHVAIAWAGAPGNAIDRHRSIPFAEFLALREVPGIALYSVQVGERARDLHDAGGAALVRDLSPWIRDARDCAGVLAEMDLVVACESFVGHLAGAMGLRTALLCSYWGRDWRASPYLGDRVLWYDRHTVYRQGPEAAWGPVFKRVVEELSDG